MIPINNLKLVSSHKNKTLNNGKFRKKTVEAWDRWSSNQMWEDLDIAHDLQAREQLYYTDEQKPVD